MNIDSVVFHDLLRLVIHLNTDKVRQLAEELFELYNENIDSLGPTDVKYSNLYISIIKEVVNNQFNASDNKIDIRNTFQRFTNTKMFRKDKFVIDALKDILESRATPNRLGDIAKRLNNLVAWYKSKEYVGKLDRQLKDCKLGMTVDDQTSKIDQMKSLVDEFKGVIMELDHTVGKGGPVEVIDFSQKGSIKEAYDMFKERQVDHVIRSGWQGLNKMCGDRGGFALGESVCFAARQHSFKSGMLLKIPQWISAYTKPPVDDHKKPMILMITLENASYMNMIQMFKQMYISCHKTPPPPGMTDDEMVNSIYEYFNQSDYTLIIERYLPSNFGYEELTRLMEKYENSGYRIVSTVIDYLALMKTHNGTVSKSGDHMLLQELFSKTVNYHKAVGTTMFTAAQLNRGASDVVAAGGNHPVKQFSERHIAGSLGIAREVDMLFYLNIESDEQGESWLTIQWGKTRYLEVAESQKFCAYKFHPEIGIPDDLEGSAQFVRDIYKKSKGQSKMSDINEILGSN